MGLGIAVYRSRESLGVDVDSLGAVKDPDTGQYYVPSSFGRDVLPREMVAAVRWRVGNMSGVAELREELEHISGGNPLILIEKCLYNGIHGGDVISLELFDKLEREIHELQAGHGTQLSNYLKDFLAKMLEIIQIARKEKNPIVFV